MYKGRVVGFSSVEAAQTFQKALQQFDDAQNNRRPCCEAVNETCPLSGKPVASDSLALYRDMKVGFCNPSCRDSFVAATTAFDRLIAKNAAVAEAAAKRARIEETPSPVITTSSEVSSSSNEESTSLGRCGWTSNDPLLIAYHDSEWGVPSYDDRYLFEMLILEGAQAGLNWRTVLMKRENYRRAFDNFDIPRIAAYSEDKIASLLQNPGIIRNRLKISAAIANAQAALRVQEEFGSLSQYLWGFVNNTPINNSVRIRRLSDVPVTSAVSDALSGDLKRRGFRFVGSTIMYAFMQAVGMVNDHEHTCRHK